MLRALARRLTGRHDKPAPTLCESCGQVCTEACRAQAIRDRAKVQALGHGWHL